ALAEAQEDYQRRRATDRLVVDEQERQRILALATDFPAVWRDPKTPQRERKRMLALLIEDVTLIRRREITAAVRFRGGATTTLTLPRPLTAPGERRSADARLRAWLAVAGRVHRCTGRPHPQRESGLRIGAGDVFDTASVQWVRSPSSRASRNDYSMAA